jgi:hypothetical protein
MAFKLNNWSVVLPLVLLTGCAKLAHLDQLLTLQDLSNEQGAQAKYIEEQNARFESLLAVVKSGDIDIYSSRETFRNDFGEPVLKRQVTLNGLELEMWLYRYPAKLTGSEKVYL